eukprot:COSAG03_NODE_7916_length_856_cov_0.665786_1_plen_87_part_10
MLLPDRLRSGVLGLQPLLRGDQLRDPIHAPVEVLNLALLAPQLGQSFLGNSPAYVDQHTHTLGVSLSLCLCVSHTHTHTQTHADTHT